jgi:hypothetical protein
MKLKRIFKLKISSDRFEKNYKHLFLIFVIAQAVYCTLGSPTAKLVFDPLKREIVIDTHLQNHFEVSSKLARGNYLPLLSRFFLVCQVHNPNAVIL